MPTAHIVDVLIAERAPRLSASAAWPLVKPVLYLLLDYAKARRMAEAIAPMAGREAVDFVSDLLQVRVEASGLDRIPPTGRMVAVCNHPTGLTDGFAVYDALRPIRPDLMIYANSDAQRVSPRLDEVLIPVEWVEEKRTRERTRLTLKMSQAAFEAEQALVIFPAGRLARRERSGLLTDPPWQATAVSLARRYEAPIVPLHLSGPPSTLFHFFDGLSQELRDITLFHEMLNKRGLLYRLTVGAPIPASGLIGDAGDVTERLKAHVERALSSDPDAVFA